MRPPISPRHCERSDVSAVARRAKAEAIQLWCRDTESWIASSLALLATTGRECAQPQLICPTGKSTSYGGLRQNANLLNRINVIWVVQSHSQK
jgi:hypothetical protein